MELPWPPHVHHPPSTSMFTNPNAHWTLSFWFFMEGSLQYARLMKSLVSGDCFNLQPLFSLWRLRGWGLKFQSTMVQLVSLATSPQPYSFPSHSININPGVADGFTMNNKNLYFSHHLGNWKGFRSSVPGMGMKTKYVFLIKNHSITIV